MLLSPNKHSSHFIGKVIMVATKILDKTGYKILQIAYIKVGFKIIIIFLLWVYPVTKKTNTILSSTSIIIKSLHSNKYDHCEFFWASICFSFLGMKTLGGHESLLCPPGARAGLAEVYSRQSTHMAASASVFSVQCTVFCP